VSQLPLFACLLGVFSEKTPTSPEPIVVTSETGVAIAEQSGQTREVDALISYR